jgi:hypothetical protein
MHFLSIYVHITQVIKADVVEIVAMQNEKETFAHRGFGDFIAFHDV